MVLIVSDHFEIRFFLASAPFYCGFCGCSFWKRKKNMDFLIGKERDLLFQRKGRDKNKKCSE